MNMIQDGASCGCPERCHRHPDRKTAPEGEPRHDLLLALSKVFTRHYVKAEARREIRDFLLSALRDQAERYDAVVLQEHIKSDEVARREYGRGISDAAKLTVRIRREDRIKTLEWVASNQSGNLDAPDVVTPEINRLRELLAQGSAEVVPNAAP